MDQTDLKENPFKVFTPEDMDAKDVYALFVDPFTDFAKISEPGHTMVNGPRGCGKSMIFRYLLPDCQSLSQKTSISKLPFLAFLISIKNTTPNLTEFRRLKDMHADIVLNEHQLTVYVASKIFGSLAKMQLPSNSKTRKEAVSFFEKTAALRLRACGAVVPELPNKSGPPQLVFEHLTSICDELTADIVQYARRLDFPSLEPIPYTSALCGYMDFLFPLMQSLKKLSFLPSGPFYLLIDDADYLNVTQTKVLNTWVSTRTQMSVSLKISTQLRYKTFETVSGLPVQSPHDYQSINIADIYTTKQSRYLNRVEKIVEKRLQKAGVTAGPHEFFPPDQAQEDAIAKIAERIRKEYPEKGRGYRAEDDVARYARPEYIRSLGGASKSSSTFSYSGFDQLVHISSGLVRYFLEPAAQMFDEQRSKHSGKPVTSIEPNIQDQIVRDEANDLMFGEFDKMRSEAESHQALVDASGPRIDEVHLQMDKLRNLIASLGGTFYLKLVSDDAERKVFSVAISGQPDNEVLEVFELGVRCGYFHRSSIGNKDGTGRTRLYVLTRRLAPYFKLDPSSFAGYLWVTNEVLREAMENSEAVLRKIKKRGVSEYFNADQLTLFD